MRALSLRLKLLLITALVLTLTAGVIIAMSAFILRDSARAAAQAMTAGLSAQAEALMHETALTASQEIQRAFAAAFASIAVLRQQIEGSALGAGSLPPYSRDQLKQLVLASLQSNPGISSSYAQFEPNAYDGKDRENAGNLAHSSNTGTIEIYFTRERDGSFAFHSTPDPSVKYSERRNEYGQREAEWYLCPKERRKPCITNPYLYEISPGYRELMTSLTLPLIVNSQFIGVVGTDINLSVLQTAVETIFKRFFDSQGELNLISHDGLIVASSRLSNQLGKRLRDVDPELAAAIASPDLHKRKGLWFYNLPIQIANATWTVSVAVPQSKILAEAAKLEREMAHALRRASMQLALGALVMTALGLILMVFMVQSITHPLGQLAQNMRALASAEGDLTVKVMVERHAELMALGRDINRFIDKLRQMILVMKDQSQTLAKRAGELSDYAKQVGQASAAQNAQLDNIVTAMTQMASAANEVAQLAHQTAEASREAAAHIDRAQQALDDTKGRVDTLAQSLQEVAAQMSQVVERSRAIDGILLTIREIADRTNLLALNAAIEAARAGEQGRGFAVVAEEVRQLAMRTQDATKGVDELIKGLQGDVRHAERFLLQSRTEMGQTLELTQRSVELLGNAVQAVKRIDSHAVQVATAAAEQSQVSEDINRNLTSIGDAARRLAQLAKSSESAAQETYGAIQGLDDQLGLLRA